MNFLMSNMIEEKMAKYFYYHRKKKEIILICFYMDLINIMEDYFMIKVKIVIFPIKK